MSKQRTQYKIKNWSAYNKSLVRRGCLTLWIEEGLEDKWHATPGTSKRGRPPVYSDTAMELCLTLKAVFSLTYRAVQGYVASIFALAGIALKVPSYTQMSRRARTLAVPLKRATSHSGALDIVVDSTGLKLYGEGEWKVRQHGASKRRTWKKLHLGVDPLSHEIHARLLTGNHVTDAQAFPALLSQIEQPIERCAADGAYDQKPCYHACHEKQVALITPPRRGAVAQPPDTVDPCLAPRDAAIASMAQLREGGAEDALARKQWKETTDYHIRSIAENAMYRFKTLCGATLFSRRKDSQQREMCIKINIINKFTSLGMPISDVHTT